MMTNFKIFESKYIQNLYHILDIEKLYYVLKNNEIKSYNFPYISTTRNKMMSGYCGDRYTSIFKLELDGQKLSDNYRMKSYQDTGWEIGMDNRRTPFFHQEWEEQIQTNKIKNARKYIVRIILIKSRIERMKDSSWFENHFSERGRKEKWISLPDILKDIIDKYKIELWVQEGSVIKKDDNYVDSIINYKVREKFHGHALYWRGHIKRNDRLGYDELVIPYDKRNPVIEDLVVGHDYENIWVRSMLILPQKNVLKKRPDQYEFDCSLNLFDFEYNESDVIKRSGNFILIKTGKLNDIDPIQKYDHAWDREMILDKEF